jgi:hypothetical protein
MVNFIKTPSNDLLRQFIEDLMGKNRHTGHIQMPCEDYRLNNRHSGGYLPIIKTKKDVKSG